MKVKDIIWLNQESGEATVTISDGEFSCNIYSMPCSLKIGERLSDPIACTGDSGIKISKITEFKIKKLENEYKYELIGRIFDKKKNIINVGGILFATDSTIPGDMYREDWIQLVVDKVSW